MKFIDNLRIGTRLGAAFAAVLALAVALGAFALFSLSRVNNQAGELATNWLPSVRALGGMSKTVAEFRRFELQQVLVNDAKEIASYDERMANALKTLDKLKAEYEPLIDSADEKAGWAEFTKAWAAYLVEHEKMVALARANRDIEAAEMSGGTMRDMYRTTTAQLQTLVDINSRGADAAGVASQATYVSARNGVLAALAAMLLLGIGAAIVITRSLTRPIAQALQVARTVAAGDLSSQIEVTRSDETGQLLLALKEMNTNLVNIVGQVRHSSDSIATGSAQIASGNADLSQRTEEQASNLQQTAASMEQMSSTVKQNADTARTATQLATSASAAATRGGEVVGRVVATMGEISASSRRIADIIGTIDGIAFQTNILALNAAVEAARAGEQGRGFAVVASEVRSLAQRSAEAAREIKALIGQSVEKVEAGSQLVGDAGASMDDIVGQVRRVADLITEIGGATHEQTQGIGQVSDAVAQLDQVTQQNAALVEESAAAAESLRQQAARLAEAVGVFRLGGAAA